MSMQELEPNVERIKSPLDRAIFEFQNKPHNSESFNSFQRVFWDQIGEITGVKIELPVMVESAQEIALKVRKGQSAIYVPEAYAGQQNRSLLAQAFRLVHNDTVPNYYDFKGNSGITDDESHLGFRWVDSLVNSRHTDISEDAMRAIVKDERGEGLTLTEYLIASLQYKLLNGKYLDQGQTWTRLLSSSRDSKTVCVDFRPEGSVSVFQPLNRTSPSGSGVLGTRFSWQARSI